MFVLIQQGGFYLYCQDGSVFGNCEQCLLQCLCGYYCEYIVDILGVGNWGVCCIVIGGNLLIVWFYIDDYYEIFCSFDVLLVGSW